jgi:hypothetical protein
MKLERGSSTVVVRAYVRPPRRRSGDRPTSDLGLDLSAVALARGLKSAGADAVTTYREDGRVFAEWEEPAGDELGARRRLARACVAGFSQSVPTAQLELVAA